MYIAHMYEYRQLVSAIMTSKACDKELAKALLDDAIVDIEQGDASYAGAAIMLGLHVSLNGSCGFDAADYLSCIV